ncbi:Lrp/AsnC family transcriptional regulator [Actinoplanes sp. HUAS TT8]|uniref:Lrp/AsnC family transcriptional regulator n=1 Tax=Actinoplanes sp. HUAS TT8 TaxID=3447453 RepID=UPI003F51ADE2
METVILDELDRQLAHALQVDGRVSFSRVAAVLGTSDRTIARRYQRLRSTGTLRVVGLPDATAIGHVDWLVRMHCTPDAAVPVSAALARRADTSWVTILSGGTEITCITRTRKQAQDGELLLQKLPRTTRITSVTAHCMLRGVAGTSGWPGRTAALAPEQVAELAPPPGVRPAGEVPLSEADNALLGVLAQDGRASFPVLAAATGWSETTVRRRLDELRRSDVLYFDVEIEPVLFGYAAEAMLWLTVAPSALGSVTRALATHPQIGYASAVTGPANVAASVICRNLDDLYEYLATGVGSLAGISHADTSPVVRRVKAAGVR